MWQRYADQTVFSPKTTFECLGAFKQPASGSQRRSGSSLSLSWLKVTCWIDAAKCKSAAWPTGSAGLAEMHKLSRRHSGAEWCGDKCLRGEGTRKGRWHKQRGMKAPEYQRIVLLRWITRPGVRPGALWFMIMWHMDGFFFCSLKSVSRISAANKSISPLWCFLSGILERPGQTKTELCGRHFVFILLLFLGNHFLFFGGSKHYVTQKPRELKNMRNLPSALL